MRCEVVTAEAVARVPRKLRPLLKMVEGYCALQGALEVTEQEMARTAAGPLRLGGPHGQD